jgi:hypothetical protein
MKKLYKISKLNWPGNICQGPEAIDLSDFYPQIMFEDDTEDTYKERNGGKTRKEIEKQYT